MVNVKELRIGNFLVDAKDRLCKVEYIDENEFKAYAVKGALTTGTTEPIPLTEEILLKCGFVKGKNLNWGNPVINIDGISWMGTSYGDIFFNQIKPPCKHLHQLQNLFFSLTGEELNYKP